MNACPNLELSWTTSAQGASQVELEYLYAKSQLVPSLREDFASEFSSLIEQHEQTLGDMEIPCPKGFVLDLMVQACIHKRVPIATMVGILVRYFEEESFPYQACADAIVLAASANFVNLHPREKPGSRHDNGELIYEVIVEYDMLPETRERIEQFQYPLPMIEEPLEARHNRETGYRTIKGSLILKKNHHDDDICLDHINRVNRVNLKINADTVAFVQNSWKNLDKQKPDESYPEFQKRKKAFQKYDRVSRDVIEAMLMQPHGFWLTHKYDKRGRTYSQGYHATYQGNDWNKSVIEFANPETLNEE